MKLMYGEKLGLPVSDTLRQLINDEVNKHQISDSATAITLTYHDSSYSIEKGGFHPVEIRLERKGDYWYLSYLTDFSYASSYPELEKDIDFDVTHGVAFIRVIGELVLSHPDVQELFKIYQANFINYVEMNVFDEIKLSTD